MFHTFLTLGYILPNIYLFLRIGQLFITKGFRFYYALVYLFIAAFFPLINLFARESDGFLSLVLLKTANFLVPFYLYLFLAVLLFDIMLIVNKITKLISTEKIRSTKFRTVSLLSILILAAGVVVAGAINFNSIRISEYSIDIPRKSSKIDHLKIAFVADFHLKDGTDIGFVERFAQKIANIQPDLMLFGGDIVEGGRDDGNRTVFEEIFTGIKSKYGVFAVLGNHEYYGGRDKGSFFNKSGIKLLCDSILEIDHSFRLAGRYDSHFNRRKSVSDLLKSVNDSLPLILLDHRPTEIDQVSQTIVDIQLSGHTHDGQLFPLNLVINRIYRLGWGYRKIGNTHFFVTSGIRLWGPPVRTVGKSEIMVVNVNFR
jgi:predicted MPP superfamily phosphohydrolase